MKENGTMNWLEQIHQMKNRDIRTIEQSELQELPQDAVEHGLQQEERLKNLLDKMALRIFSLPVSKVVCMGVMPSIISSMEC